MSESWIQIQNKPIKEMQKLNLQLAGSRHIRDDSGLTIYSVEGNQQGGKTTYCQNILYELYRGDVDKIMDMTVMGTEGFINKIDDALQNNYRHRCILWDDMSVEGSASLWVDDPKLVRYLAALGDTLGVATKGLLMSSPNGDMIKAFRSYQKYIVMIGAGRHKFDRVARGYFIGKSPMKQRYCSPVFEDEYDIRVPFYERYATKRRELSIDAVKKMRALSTANAEQITPKKITKTDLAQEYVRKFKAGVYKGVFGTMKDLAKFTNKEHGISYQTLCNNSGLV